MLPRILSSLLLALLVASPVCARQFLVPAGDDWQRIGSQLKPGDEIILMSGRHRAVKLRDLQGTKRLPIVIRGLDPRNPPTIDGRRYGLRLENPSYLLVKDLRINGATINGLVIEGDEMGDRATSIRLENVTVNRTGPQGERHGILIRHADDLSIEGCTIAGWGGSGIELIDCQDVVIERCSLTGLENHTQVSGIRIRGGSTDVRIKTCRIQDPGDQGICIGGNSSMEDFPKSFFAGAKRGTLFEASRVRIANCIFVGGECAIAFVNCERGIARNCTISRPNRAVVSIRNDQTDPRFAPLHSCIIGNNLITWEPGDLTRLTHVGKTANLEGITLEENLWWTPNWPEVKDHLGEFPGRAAWTQVTDVDPKLNDRLKPTTAAAELFGAYGM